MAGNIERENAYTSDRLQKIILLPCARSDSNLPIIVSKYEMDPKSLIDSSVLALSKETVKPKTNILLKVRKLFCLR
jgi:hypothetical protein